MTVYLIHLARPYHHARHYLGYTGDLAHRLMQHHNGTGAKFLKAVTKAGIPFEVVRTWEGYAALEKQLKAQKNAPRLCPVCLQQRIVRAMNLPQARTVEPSRPGFWPEVLV
jgi:predicted GIY-YIG superfamily endonuclease